MMSPDVLQRRAISFAVLTLCLCALFLIATILDGSEFDDTSAKFVITAAAMALYLLIGLAGHSLSLDRPDLASVGWLTVLVAAMGFVSGLFVIWEDWDGAGDSAEPAAVLLAASVALGHSSMLLRGSRPTDDDAVRLVRGGTILAVCLLATMLAVEVSSNGEQVSAQGIGVLAVLYILGTALLPLVRRLTPASPVAAANSVAAPTPTAPASTAGRRPPTPNGVSVRSAYASDAEAIVAIYNQGIEDREATFQTRQHEPGELELKVEQRGGTLFVAERDDEVVGWAGWSGYDDPAEHYAGIGECAVYVAREARGGGTGALLLEALAVEAPRAGIDKLVAKIFTTNQASIALFRRCGFRDVGTHVRHGRLEGEWRDVLIMERLLNDA